MRKYARTNTAVQWITWIACLACLASVRAASYEVTEPFIGVRHFHRVASVPRLLDMHILEIDPAAPGIDFLVTPSNGSAPGETVRQTTRDFLAEHDAQIAINGSFFEYVSGPNMNIQGLAASRGNIYSTFQAARLVALNISQDNIATIIQSTTGSGTAHNPPASLYNAVGGDARLIANGIITANPADTSLHPRTAAGVTADGKLLLFTVDGRNAGHSLGMSTPEVANLLLEFGAINAVNLDGGGSTTLVFGDPSPRVVNVPVGTGPPGSERQNGNNLAVFASSPSAPTGSRYVFADFTAADESYFSYGPTFSGSTEGILETSSISASAAGGIDNTGTQRIAIRDDPTTSGGPENPDGWFVRHVSGRPGAGSAASRSSNEVRPTMGVIGLWAKTAQQDIEISIAIDNSANVTSNRGTPRTLVADNQWHRYEWNLEDDAQWEGWFEGDGLLDTPDFTLDSIHIFGPNSNAAIFIDEIYHETMPNIPALAGDFDANGTVDAADYTVWRDTYGRSGDRLGADGDLSGTIDEGDYLVWKNNFGRRLNGSAYSQNGATIPEPCGAALVAVGCFVLLCGFPRRASAPQ